MSCCFLGPQVQAYSPEVARPIKWLVSILIWGWRRPWVEYRTAEQETLLLKLELQEQWRLSQGEKHRWIWSGTTFGRVCLSIKCETGWSLNRNCAKLSSSDVIYYQNSLLKDSLNQLQTDGRRGPILHLWSHCCSDYLGPNLVEHILQTSQRMRGLEITRWNCSQQGLALESVGNWGWKARKLWQNLTLSRGRT